MGGEYSTTKLYLISPAWVAESPNVVGGLVHCSEEVTASREFRGMAHRDSGLGFIRAQENPAGADTQSEDMLREPNVTGIKGTQPCCAH